MNAPVGAIVTTIALPFGIEGAYMWPVAFVIGFGPRQLFQHLSTSRGHPTIIQPILTPSELAYNHQQNSVQSSHPDTIIPLPPDSVRNIPD